MTQWPKPPAANLDDMKSVMGLTHLVEGENQLCMLSSKLHVNSVPTQINVKKKIHVCFSLLYRAIL